MDSKAILITIFSLFVLTLKVQSAITRRELLDNLTSVSTYDQSYPSGYDENIQCAVIVQLEISDVTSISEQNMEYSLMMFLRMQWKDSRLAFYDVANFTRIDLTGDMVDLIWKPDLYISNERRVDAHSLVKHEELAYIDPNGTVTFSMRISMTGYCHMDLNLYPFDVQTCNVKLQSYAFTSDKLLFQWSKNGLLTPHIDLANYEVEVGENSEGLETNTDRSLAGGEFSFLITGVKFKRRSSAYGSMYFAPFPIFFIIAMCSYWFKDQMGTRVSLCTAGLSSTLLQWIAIYSRLPPVWYFTFLDGWILFHISMIGAIFIFQGIWYKYVHEAALKNRVERIGYVMFLSSYAIVCITLLVEWSGSNKTWIWFDLIPGIILLRIIVGSICFVITMISGIGTGEMINRFKSHLYEFLHWFFFCKYCKCCRGEDARNEAPNMVGLRARFGAPLTGLNSPAVIIMLLTVPRRRPSVFLRCMSMLFHTVLVTLFLVSLVVFSSTVYYQHPLKII